MKVALFVPCYVDQLYPQVGLATARVLERLGVDGGLPRGADLLRPADGQRGLRRRRGAARAALPRGLRRLRRRGLPLRQLHVDGAQPLRPVPRRPPRVRPAQGLTFELCEFLHDVLGVRSLPGALPAEGRAAPELPRPARAPARLVERADRAALRQGRGRSSGARGASSSWSSQRTDECCGFGGTFAVVEEAVSCLMGRDRIADHVKAGRRGGHRHGRLVPDAHGRPRAPRPGCRSRSGTSPRSSTEALAAGRRGMSEGHAERGRALRRPTSRVPTGTTRRSGSCARSATAPPARSRSGSGSARSRRRSRPTPGRTSPTTSRSSSGTPWRAGSACTGRATRTSTTGSCTASWPSAASRGS